MTKSNKVIVFPREVDLSRHTDGETFPILMKERVSGNIYLTSDGKNGVLLSTGRSTHLVGSVSENKYESWEVYDGPVVIGNNLDNWQDLIKIMSKDLG